MAIVSLSRGKKTFIFGFLLLVIGISEIFLPVKLGNFLSPFSSTLTIGGFIVAFYGGILMFKERSHGKLDIIWYMVIGAILVFLAWLFFFAVCFVDCPVGALEYIFYAVVMLIILGVTFKSIQSLLGK